MARIPIPTADTGSGLLVPTYAELAPQASAPAAPATGKGRLYLDANGLLQLLPTTGGARRLTTDWGSGQFFPAVTPQPGDVFRHTGLGCLMVWNGTAWRQEDIPSFATAVARTNMSGTYSAALYTGFRVRQTDSGNTWEWTGSAWRAIPDYTFPTCFARQNVVDGSIPAGWHIISLDIVDNDSHAGFTTGTVMDATTSSRYVVPTGQDGLYAVEGAAILNIPTGSVYNARLIKNNATLPASYGSAGGNNTGTTQSLGAATGRHLLTLAGGDTLQLQAYCNVAYSSAVFSDGASWLTVERIR